MNHRALQHASREHENVVGTDCRAKKILVILTISSDLNGYGYGDEQIPGYGHLPPRFVPHVVRAELGVIVQVSRILLHVL